MIDPNLTLTGYGVTLRRLTHDKIEMLRQWRNDPKIQQYMVYREYITPEMQEVWFQKINNDHNFYFIIEYEGREVGMINIKDVDYEKKTGEPGIFIYDERLWDSDVGIRTSLCFGEFLWNTLSLDSTYVHVVASNKRAVQFNQFLDYEIIQNDKDSENIMMILKREKALNPNPKLAKIIRLFSNNN